MFDTLLSNNRMKTELTRAITLGRHMHAYLFCGADGSGKMTAAKLLARELVGANKDKADRGSHPDIFILAPEKDKKTITVDQVRNMRSDTFVNPSEGTKKVYIVDGMELMNESGQNALLKVLEEPPAYGVFLLLVDNPQKLLTTIRSRCVELALSPLPEELLQRELSSRFPDVPIETLRAVYSRSGGYLGQALKLLSGDGELLQETTDLVRAFASKSRLGLAQVLVTMEKWKRDRLIDALNQWKSLFAEALACRGGGAAVSPLARELSASRGPDELLAAIRQLDKCIEYAQGNVSPAAICGYLIWAL